MHGHACTTDDPNLQPTSNNIIIREQRKVSRSSPQTVQYRQETIFAFAPTKRGISCSTEVSNTKRVRGALTTCYSEQTFEVVGCFYLLRA